MGSSDDQDVEKLKAADAKHLHRAVREEGRDELDRPIQSLFWSALAAGLGVGASLLAEGALYAGLPDTPSRILVVSLGYPIGFLIVILGRMQLFTESTITAMLPLVAEPSWDALTRTLRLWAVVLVGNLIGVALVAGAIASGGLAPEMRDAMIAISLRIVDHSAIDTFLHAIPAGFLIAILAWMLPSARGQSVLVIAAITWVVGVGGFTHSVVGSMEAFLLVFTGHIGVGQTAALIVPTVLGNLVGGSGIFTLLAHGQVRGEIE